MIETAKPPLSESHRFLDEAGDTTFFGKGKVPSIGREGVSLSFSLGMVKFRGDLSLWRDQVKAASNAVAGDAYLNRIPSVANKIRKGGFYFHATDDPPEVRERMMKLVLSMDCGFEAVVGRKIPELFAKKHHHKEAEFYADLLSHLIKNKFKTGDRLVLNIADREAVTRHANLQRALEKAKERFLKKGSPQDIKTRVVFNVQTPRTEPLLCVVDYFCWVVQRVFERGETRHYDFLKEKIRVVVDLYDAAKWPGSKNYYRPENPLTAANKLSPPPP